jgi:hypothetical protein
MQRLCAHATTMTTMTTMTTTTTTTTRSGGSVNVRA